MPTTLPQLTSRHGRQWLIFVALAAALGAVLVALLLIERDSVQRDQGQRLLSQVHVLEQNLGRQIESTNRVLTGIVAELTSLGTEQRAARVGTRLLAVVEAMPGVRTINVLDRNGVTRVSNRPELVGIDFSGREYFRTARAGDDIDRLYVSRPFRTQLGVWAMNLVRVVHDGEGQFAGIVAATADPDYFNLLLGSVVFAPDVLSTLSHDSGVLFLVAPRREDLEGKDVSGGNSFLSRHLASGQDESLLDDAGFVTADDRLSALRTVRPVGVKIDHPLIVSISRDLAQSLAAWRQEAAVVAIMFVIVLLVSAGGLLLMHRAELRHDQAQRGVLRDLREADARLTLALAAGRIGTWDWDLRTGQTKFGGAFDALLGQATGSFSGGLAEFLELVHADDRSGLRSAVESAIAQRVSLAHEFRVLWPNGSLHWLASRGHLTLGPQGEPLRLAGVIVDFTERVQGERLRQQRDLAEAANRAKTDFLSRMSHELRTPLNAVLGFAQLLSARIGSATPQQQREHVRQIEQAGWHLLAMIDEVLDLSRIESGRIDLRVEPVALAQVINEATALVEGVCRKQGVRLRVAPIAPTAAVLADPMRLRQVLTNLLSNAVNYNRADGTIDIDLRRAGDRWQVAVADTGVGMSAEQLAHLFEPFNRLGHANSTIEGSGIGLVIARRLIEAMGGTLSVDSRAGEGSTFKFLLPATEPAIGAKTVVAMSPAGVSSPAVRVLYVEDNAINAAIVQSAFDGDDWRVQVAPDAANGLRLAQEWVPHVILIDMRLPDFDGLELRRRLLANPATARVPCIAVTAQATVADRQAATDLDFFAYVVKPFDLNTLRAFIRDALDAPSGRATTIVSALAE